MARRRIVVLGSTGSIGTQALDVVARNPDRFEVVGLTAGSNRDLVAEQAARFGVRDTAFGAQDSEQLVRSVEADVVLNGITGSVGLGPTLAALETGATLALANKESLIVGGSLVQQVAAPGQIVPVDSEHSAIAQALRSGADTEAQRLVLTASGGPFRGRTREQLRDVTPAQALAHPTWHMGLVVTTNSATLVNKGLEVIEAHLLFGVPYDRIDVTVHAQSIVHSMVEFVDGSIIAQASPPDMRLPIALGLAWPDRVPGSASRSTGPRRAPGPSSRSTRTRSAPSRSRSASANSAGPSRRCSTPRTNRQWPRSTRAPSGSWTSSTRSSASSRSTLRGSRHSTACWLPSIGPAPRRTAR